MEERCLTQAMFSRQLPNKEIVQREWLIYSPAKGKVYCFACKLFSHSKFPFSGDGFNDWKHALKAASEHENSQEHRNCMVAYCSRSKTLGRIDTQLVTQFNNERQYWKEVLKRVTAVIKFLASRGLPLRGSDQRIGSVKNGNYLGILELISQFDPFLHEHIKKYGNAGKGIPSYLSATICEEFVEIMGTKVLSVIISEIQKAKYYAISVDSTPDVTHIDQLTFIVRYVIDAVPKERFLQFIPIHGHNAEHLTEVVTHFLETNNIDILNCRGQSYDNAANMSGRCSGLQAKIKELNKYAEYVPCAGHSLNLVGVHAVKCVSTVTIYFDVVQNLYTFFSSSTHRWEILRSHLGPHHKVVKQLSDTRWSAQADAINALCEGYNEIRLSLQSIRNDVTNQSLETRLMAQGLEKKLDKLETVFLTILWNEILSRFNAVSKLLQSEKVNLSVAVKMLKSLIVFIREKRDGFDDYESKSKAKSVVKEYHDTQRRQTKRSSILAFADGGCSNEELLGREKFRVETFLPIIDTLVSSLELRSKAYIDIFERFGFLESLHVLESSEISKYCENLANFYSGDFITAELISECHHFAAYLKVNIKYFQEYAGDDNEKNINIHNLYSYMNNENILSAFPNMEIAMRIFLTLFVTNASGERSFSKLKLIKDELRNCMAQPRLNNLSLMSIEHDILAEIDFEDTIHDFASSKCRKVLL